MLNSTICLSPNYASILSLCPHTSLCLHTIHTVNNVDNKIWPLSSLQSHNNYLYWIILEITLTSQNVLRHSNITAIIQQPSSMTRWYFRNIILSKNITWQCQPIFSVEWGCILQGRNRLGAWGYWSTPKFSEFCLSTPAELSNIILLWAPSINGFQKLAQNLIQRM